MKEPGNALRVNPRLIADTVPEFDATLDRHPDYAVEVGAHCERLLHVAIAPAEGELRLLRLGEFVAPFGDNDVHASV